VLIGVALGGKLIEKVLHGDLVGARHHPGEGLVGARAHRGKDVGEGEAFVGKPRWALALAIPAMADAALLTDPRFVLEPERDALTFMYVGNRL
ncbi:MAG: hypothetical protein V3V97_04230, partial [Hyphomicrobiaceae bacterium]